MYTYHYLEYDVFICILTCIVTPFIIFGVVCVPSLTHKFGTVRLFLSWKKSAVGGKPFKHKIVLQGVIMQRRPRLSWIANSTVRNKIRAPCFYEPPLSREKLSFSLLFTSWDPIRLKCRPSIITQQKGKKRNIKSIG